MNLDHMLLANMTQPQAQAALGRLFSEA